MLLEVFRTHKRWLMFIAMVLVIPSFVVTGIYSYNRMVSDDGALAKVDDESILPQDFDQQKRKQLDNLRSRLGEQFRPNMLESQDARAMILRNIMTERSLQGEATQEYVEITEATAIEMIKSFPAFQKDGKFSRDLYENYLRGTGQTDEYFVYTIRRDISRQLLAGGIARSAIAPLTLAKHVNVLLNEERAVKVPTIGLEKYIEKISITDEQARTYWMDNQKKFELPDEIDVEYVVFTPNLFKDVEPNEDEIQAFYEQNQNRFKVPEKRRASHILINFEKGKEAALKKAEGLLAKVKANPKSFAELARKNSQDPGSAASGGDLDFFGQGMMVPAFDEAVFKAKKGDILGPVETDFGYHIIYVTDIAPAHIKPFKDCRAEIVELYKEQEAQKKFAAEAENFTNTVYEQSDSLEGVINKYNLKSVKLEGVLSSGVNKPGHRHFLNAAVLEALFSEECLKEKRNTQAIEVSSNTLVSARVTKYRPSHIEEFDACKERIKNDLTTEKAMEMAAVDGKKLLEEIKAGKTPSGVMFDEEETISRSKPGMYTYPVVTAVMRVPVKDLPTVIGVEGDIGYMLVSVGKSTIAPAQKERLESDQAELAVMLGRADESAYYAAMRRKHDATVLNKDYLFEEK